MSSSISLTITLGATNFISFTILVNLALAAPTAPGASVIFVIRSSLPPFWIKGLSPFNAFCPLAIVSGA